MNAPDAPATEPSAEELRHHVRERYGQIAAGAGSCCGGSGCCGSSSSASTPTRECADCGSGYSAEELAGLPAEAHLGLGCGNPTALLALRPGETVLDLGSGGGIDCFLAARRVGPTGRVVGVDMTPEMLTRARKGAREGGFGNVEFRLGEIEHLPLGDATVDVVLSNCVVNLSTDQDQVYREAFRVLRPGGRLVISDRIATRPIPAAARADPDRWSSCSSGARTRDEIARSLRSAGFEAVDVSMPTQPSELPILSEDDLGVVSGTVAAVKPGRA